MLARTLWIAVTVLLLDQASKRVVLHVLAAGPLELAPVLNLALAFNTGAAFSFLGDAGGWQNGLFIAIALAASAVLIGLTLRLKAGEGLTALAFMLVLGGAVGNLIDRLLYGHVVDFIDLHYAGWHWPTFNVADAAITGGALLLALEALGLGRPRRADPHA